MRTYTASELETRVRQYADVVHDTQHVTSSEIYTRLSVAFGELWDSFITTNPAYYTKFETWTGDGTTNDFSVASDYYFTVGIDRQVSTGNYETLASVGIGERNIAPTTVGTATYWHPVYNTEAQGKIRLLPTPASGQTYRHAYVRSAPKITAGSDVIDGLNGLEDGACLLAAIGICIKQARRDTESSLQAQLNRFEERLLRNVARRTPGRVVDVYGADFTTDPSDRRYYPYGSGS
jgi:hypothetical protein